MQNALHFGDASRRFRADSCPRTLRIRLRAESALARVSVRRAGAVVAVSQSLRALIEADMGPRHPVRVIPSAAPTLPPASEPTVSGRYVLCVADDHLHKDWDALVSVFGVQDLPALVAVGGFSPVRRRRLEALAAPGRVCFAGVVTDRALLAGLYRGAICCIAHSWVESYGLTPLEALACGTPVIASDIPAHREVCGDDVSYYDPGDMAAMGRIVRETVAAASEGRPKTPCRAFGRGLGNRMQRSCRAS